MDRNPLEGDFRVEDRVADHEKRDAFQPEQLRTLFNAAPWDGSFDRSGPKAGKFWIPLLCLFHGLRLGEAAGMHVEDVTDREGVPVLAAGAAGSGSAPPSPLATSALSRADTAMAWALTVPTPPRSV